MKSQNPLRISQESINLDDIISDLNDSHQVSQQIAPPNLQSQPLVQTKKQTIPKQPSKSKLTSSNENKNIINTGAQAKPLLTNKSGKQVIVEPPSDSKKDYLISTTTEANTTERQHTTTSSAIGGGINEQPSNSKASNRYNDSNFKSSEQNYLADDHSSIAMEAPFYLRQNLGSQNQGLTDEDVESFQKKLDTLIINFRSETMSEFMRTKKTVLQEQAAAIDGERRRCNTLLGVKQNEIEQLKESLAFKSKMCDELNVRCEGMAFWAGKSKTLLRMKLIQNRAFESLKAYWQFKRHSKKVLEHRLRQYKEDMARKVFQGWQKQYKEWKVIKNREDFEKAVKLELQTICAQYNKEIESLREKLNEANTIVDQENRNKAMMQENLKKAFMRGVCALNFEAMNILNPNDVGYQNQIEREMEKQVMLAMQQNQSNSSFSQPTPMFQDTSLSQRSPPQQQIPSFRHTTFNQESNISDTTSEISNIERRLMNIESQELNDYRRIESKDSMWKPAPIMGREIQQTTMQPQFTYAQPQVTSAIRNQNQYVLPSHFNRMNDNQPQVEVQRVESETENRVIPTQNVFTNVLASSSLPDFMSMQKDASSSGLPSIAQTSNDSQGRVIHAQQNKAVTQNKPVSSSIVGAKKTTNSVVSVGKKPVTK